MAMSDDIATTEPLRIWEGVLARTIDGAQLSLAVVELDPGSIVREHSHENEQLGFVVSGSVTFRISEETRELGPDAPPRGDWKALSACPCNLRAGRNRRRRFAKAAPAG